MRRRWQSCPTLLMGNQGGKALKRLPAHFNFSGSVSTSSGCFVPKFGVGRGTEAFIYALSADETSQNYFFISKIENYRKSFIHADLPLFCTFPKFFPKSKIGRQILPQIFSNFPKWIFPISPHFGCKIFDSQQGMCRKIWCWYQKRASSQGSSWGNIFCCNVSPQGEFRQLYKFNAL